MEEIFSLILKDHSQTHSIYRLISSSFRFNFLIDRILKETTIKRHCTRARVHDGQRWPVDGANVEIFSKFFCMTSYILESWNPPIPSRHVSSLTMSNFDAYRHKMKKFQCGLHSLIIVRGRWKTIFVMGVLEVPWHFKISVPQRFYIWKWWMMKMRHGWSQLLCVGSMYIINPLTIYNP